MSGFLAMIRSIGVSFGDTFERYRDPSLISCALFLIILALGYLVFPGFRHRTEHTLGMKRPTLLKRLFGGLLILLPGVFVLASTHFTQLTHALEQRWPGLAQQYIATGETQNRELISHRSTGRAARKKAPVKNVRNRQRTQTTNRAEVELKQKLAARRALEERRRREQQRRSNRIPNIWLTKKGEVGAISADVLDEAIGHLAEKNLEAFHRLEALQRVFFFKEGEKVTIVDYEYTTGKVKIKLLSTNMELWTLRKSLVRAKS